jgi:hypothetical protein
MNIEIAKIKIRRGTDAQRKSTILDQGEIAFTLDTKRLYVGNGVLSGGTPASNKIFAPLSNVYSLTATPSEIGDFGIANNAFYQLTASDYTNLNSWINVNPKVDGGQLEYSGDNTITIKLSSLSAFNIDPVTVGNGIKIQGGTLQTNFNTKSLEISSNQISLKAAGINEREIASSTFTSGLTGGSGNKVGIRFDPKSFYLSGGMLALSSITTISSVDNITLENTGGVISMKDSYSASTVELSRTTRDKFGRVTAQTSSIFDTLTGNSTLNGNNSLSAIFNGTPTHTLSGGIPGLTITRFEAISSNGVSTTTLTLSSAGFLTFEGGYPTRSGKLVGRFAIPIFAY